jgi:hypothetical protein
MQQLKQIVRKNKVSVAIVLFLIIFSVIHQIKPQLLYNKNGGFRQFGVGYKNKTIFPIWIVAIVVAIFSYLAVSYYLLFW